MRIQNRYIIMCLDTLHFIMRRTLVQLELRANFSLLIKELSVHLRLFITSSSQNRPHEARTVPVLQAYKDPVETARLVPLDNIQC